MLVSAGVLLVSYVLIFTEVVHRTIAAIAGAVAMVGIGHAMGFYSQEAAVMAVDANTVFLLFGMMVIVAVLRPTGAFEYAAIRIAKLAGGRPAVLLVALGFAVSVISMVLDNVTTIIAFAPITVLITRILHLNPMPYLVSAAMLSNVGGAATLVGDPPNIMIGGAADLSFIDFIVHMGPPVAAVWLVTVSLLLVMFRGQLVLDGSLRTMDLDERRAIRDMPNLKRALTGLAVVVALFFAHHPLGIYPSFAALLGVALLLLLARPDPERVLADIHWSMLLFFAGLFVIVGGVEASGLLDVFGTELGRMALEPGQLIVTAVVLMWVAALLSALVDNIPFTVTMIPIIAGLEQQGVNAMPLWWALALGVGIGGNTTHLGATANIVTVTELEDCGIPSARVSPLRWLRIGLPTALVGLTVATFVFVAFFEHFL